MPEKYILCGNGAAELIYAYCEAVKPKRAVELAPTFSEYTLGAKRTGCKMLRYILSVENDFTLTEDFLKFLCETNPDTVFLCNPNNPTGRTVDEGLMRKILALCRVGNIRLFVDECFLDLCDTGSSLKTKLADNPNLFILKAFTKSYGMAGIRLGYCLCGDKELLKQMSCSVQPWNVSSLAQAAGVAALEEGEFLEQTKDLIRRERQWLRQELMALGFYVCDAKVNYLLFKGPEGLHEKLAQKGISIRNCDNYFGLDPGWYRTAVRLHEENVMLIESIQRIC